MSRKRIVTFIIIFFALSLVSIICFSGFNKKDRLKCISKNKDIGAKSIWYKPDGNASKIDIYYLKTNNSYVQIKEDADKNFIDSMYDYKNTYNCTNINCKMYQFNFNSYKVVVKDGGYVLYDFNKNKAKKLKLPDGEYNDIKLLSSNKIDYGLAISNTNDMYAFYSFDKNAFTTVFKYSNIYDAETDGLLKGYISGALNTEEKSKYIIVDYKNDSIIYESDVYIGIIGNENKIYFYKKYADLSGSSVTIYDSHFKPLFGEDAYNLFGVSETGNIILKNNNKNTFSMYSDEGKIVKTSKEYKEIFMIVKDYVVVVDGDDILKVVDYDGNVKAKFSKLSKGYIFNEEISGLFFDNDDIILNIYIENIDQNNKNTMTRFYYVPTTKENGKIDL